jgi:hypothetical protein
MVAATTGGTMNIGVRRRLTALVAAIGVATTVFVTAPLAPAHAASHVHAPSPAPAGAQTTTIHAKAPGATGGKISPFSNPLDITCLLEALVPTAAGGHADSIVIAIAQITCTFDIDGSPAPVPIISLTNTLMYDGRIMARKGVPVFGLPFDAETTTSVPCFNGDWVSVAEVTVTSPDGYQPPVTSARTATATTFNFGDCPNDYVEVPNVVDEDVRFALRDLSAVELEGRVVRHDTSCDIPKFNVMDQSPNGGQLALRGSIVELTESDGRPRVGNRCP